MNPPKAIAPEPPKRTFPRAIGFTMLLITLLLGLRFCLMLFFPGTLQTKVIFQVLAPHWELFSGAVVLLKMPLTLLFNLLLPHPPPGFPEMQASLLMASFTHKPLSFYQGAYPGQVEWLTLLAIPFWNIVLLGGYFGLLLFKESAVDAVVQQSGELLADYQSQKRLNRLQAQKQKESPPPTVEPSAPADAKTQARLSQAKNLPANMPKVQRPSEEEVETYKKQEGDLIVRDMVSQLQRENSSLQSQQKHLKSTFSRYFSPQVLQYLESNKGVFQNIDNQKHMISVLFCDIRGFSTYSQSAESEELVKFLGEYFDIANYYILHKYNGIVSKLMGDGLMAYWGFPVPNADHAYIATLAAIDILCDVAERNRKNPSATPLKIGIGIATGEAIVGNIGSTDFKDFTLLGTPVNMAARLEEANKKLGTSLLISDATHAALKGRIQCQHFGGVSIRGWENPEQVYGPVIPTD